MTLLHPLCLIYRVNLLIYDRATIPACVLFQTTFAVSLKCDCYVVLARANHCFCNKRRYIVSTEVIGFFEMPHVDWGKAYLPPTEVDAMGNEGHQSSV